MELVQFKDVASRINIHVDQANTDLEYYVGGEHIESREFMVQKKALIKGSTIGYQFQFGFEPNDILFMTKNPHLRKASMADFRGLCSIATFVIRTKDSSKLLQDYLLIEMQSDRFWNYLEENKSGGVNYFINWGTLGDYEFKLPSIEEQRILADKLWSAYRLKESYKKLITATQEMVKAKFVEMFNCVDNRVSLSSVCDTFVDGDWIESKDQAESGIRLLQTGNVGVGVFKDKEDKSRFISEETFARLNCTEIFEGDILVSRLPDPVGRACIVPNNLGRCITAVDCTIIRLNNKMLKEYFLWFTKTADYRMQIKRMLSGTTRLRVSRTNLGNIQIPLPLMQQQIKFVQIAQQAEQTQTELRKSIEAIDQVIKSLINNQ